MDRLDHGCEKVLRAIIKTKKLNYYPYLESVTLMAGIRAGDPMVYQIFDALIKGEYITMTPPPPSTYGPGGPGQPAFFILTRKGEVYFSQKWREVLSGAIGWIGYALGILIGSVATWLLMKYR